MDMLIYKRVEINKHYKIKDAVQVNYKNVTEFII